LPQGDQSGDKGLVKAFQGANQLISNYKFFILLLNTFEEERALSCHELQARRDYLDHLCQAIKERAAYWKQRSKYRVVKEGDANTAFHHAQATVRLWQNNIRYVEVQGSMIASHEGKIQALSDFFSSIIADPTTPAWGFDMHAQSVPGSSTAVT
jgi:hypothetical protein